jgi:hypothetical protein
MEDLRSGKYANTIELARRFKLNNAHVRVPCVINRRSSVGRGAA